MFNMFNFLRFHCENNGKKNYKETESFRKIINIQDLDSSMDQKNGSIQDSKEDSKTDSDSMESLEKNFFEIQKKIQFSFLVLTIIFLLFHLIYFFYRKEAKYTSFLLICSFGLGIEFDNSSISRVHQCLTLSLLLIPIIYNTLFETKVSDFDNFILILFFISLNFQIVFFFNILSIFLLISSGLLTFLIIVLGKIYFLSENQNNNINLYY